MPRLLLIGTYDRDDIGEAWVAYQWASRLSERVDLTVITSQRRDGSSVADQLPHAKVVELREPTLPRRLERLDAMLKPTYPIFYRRARSWIRHALSRGERFDVAHQTIPVAMRYPCPLVGLGIPYVMGPVGGSLGNPAGFGDDETAPWFVGLRKLDQLRLRYDPLLRRTFEDAACVLGIADYVREILGAIHVRRFECMSETGIKSLPPPVDRTSRIGPIRLLFVGRLVRTKGARDAIRAMSRLRDLPVTLDVVGEGFDRHACESMIASLDLGDVVTLHGRIPRSNVDEFYQSADVFVFPSYREAGGNVVPEAMGFGLPAVVSDRGGPANVVDDSCGFRITPRDPEQYADDIAVAIREIASDAALRLRLGVAARRRVSAVALWPNKIDRMQEIYAEIISAAS